MKSITRVLLPAALAMLALSLPLFAHHGVAAFDASKTITVVGTVAEFRFANPHAIILFDVKDGQGNVQRWQGELNNRNALERLGWNSHSLKEGEGITVTGHPSKVGPRSTWITKVKLPDGKTLDGIDES